LLCSRLHFFTLVTSHPTSVCPVSWSIAGLAPSVQHHFHVHQAGFIGDTTSAVLTQGHFNGSCINCRPGCPVALQEVGQIGNGYVLMTDSSAPSTGSFYDSLPQMRGLRSIVGRSIVGANDLP
jgi:hypothetical protein